MPQDHLNDRKAGRVALLGRAIAARTHVRLALGLAISALVVCANTPAALAGDDDSDDSFLTKFMHTLGLKKAGDVEYGIDYNERSPLVVPPTRDLPPPVASVDKPAPDWPKDPDITRRKEAKKKKVERHYDFMEDSKVLSPYELDKGKTTNPNDGKAATPNGDSTLGQVNQQQMAGKKSFFDLSWFKTEEYTTFTGEPARTSLTEPPPGYQTPSPDQPYGIGKQGTKAKPKNIGERMEAESGK
jgi:hypothetical protein